MKKLFAFLVVALLFVGVHDVWAQGDVGSRVCGEAQVACIEAIAGDDFNNHGKKVSACAKASNTDAGFDITDECHSCIVNQVARRIPLAEQESCGICDPTTDVEFDGKCYYLDGSRGICLPGFVLAPQSVLNDIASDFVGKTYKTQQSNNCCIWHADQGVELQDWGMSFDCNTSGPFVQGPVLGGAGCTNALNMSTRQLTLCMSE